MTEILIARKLIKLDDRTWVSDRGYGWIAGKRKLDYIR